MLQKMIMTDEDDLENITGEQLQEELDKIIRRSRHDPLVRMAFLSSPRSVEARKVSPGGKLKCLT